jgi:hypothetical protein
MKYYNAIFMRRQLLSISEAVGTINTSSYYDVKNGLVSFALLEAKDEREARKIALELSAVVGSSKQSFPVK